MAQCQACGQEIKGKPYLWNGDPRLTLHADLRECGPVVNGLAGAQSMADFFSRNAAYLNGRGEPVLIGEERQNNEPNAGP